ncbi:MAG TPA: recombinase family protein [Candidatus Cybelea sp.]|nr:recombinase family protein [Candidatus Cybelea sp.]
MQLIDERKSPHAPIGPPSDAWLYAVVSSSPQETTLQDQRQWANQTAAFNGWVITREFSGVGSGAKAPERS